MSTINTEMPGFTFVVPTHGRVELIRKLLQSLAQARDYYMGKCEIIIVDSSLPLEAQAVQRMCDEYGARFLSDENDVRRKRNLGIMGARYDTVFFIDSDCEADPRVLNEHELTYAENQAAIGVLGVTKWRGEETGVWRILQYYPSISAAFSFANWLLVAPWGTCTNLSVRRKALLEIGGFDEAFPMRIYGEDVDLGLRLTRGGNFIKCNSRALVWHSRAAIGNYGAALRKVLRTGRADFYLGRHHPERLALEFPGSAAVTVVLVVGSLIGLLGLDTIQSIWRALLWLPLYLGCYTAIQVWNNRDSLASFPARLGGTLLEFTFEFGRLTEALRHGDFQRLWRKFTYVAVQLAAERDRRLLQMWVTVGCLLLLVFVT
jgi:GT2 family glycosyltransferase